MKHSLRNSRLLWSFTIGAAGLLYLKVWLPATKIAIPCVFHELTGLYCPGCGITRVILSLLRLDAYQAIRYNPLVFALLPMYLIYAWAKKRQMRRTSNGIMAVMVIATVGFGLARNLPAFSWMAPTDIQ